MEQVRFTDPRFQGKGYWYHVHTVSVQLGVMPDGQPNVERFAMWMVSNLSASSGGGARPRNLALFRSVNDAPYDLIKMWTEGVGPLDSFPEAPSPASVDIHPKTGDIIVEFSAGKKAGSGFAWQPWRDPIPRETFAPPVLWPPAGEEPPGSGEPGSSGYTVAPGGTVRLHAGPLDGITQKTLDMSAYGPAMAYNIRLCISADRPGARARVMPGGDTAAALTAVTQAALVRVYMPGAVNAGVGQLALVADMGPVGECFVDLLGWW